MVNTPVGLEEFFALMNIRLANRQMFLMKHAPSFPLPNMSTVNARPKTCLPDVIYQYDFETGRWQYKFDQPGSFWMNSNSMCTGDDECLTHVRRSFPERHIRFTHDPRDRRRFTTRESPLIFTAWDLDKPAAAAAASPITVKVTDAVTYRYNAESMLWEFTSPRMDGSWHDSDLLNAVIKGDPFILSDEQLERLKADWPDTEVIVEPLTRGTTYYRFAKRWEYYHKSYKAWKESLAYAGLSVDGGLPRMQRDADADRRLNPNYKIVITTIDGVRFDVWKQDRARVNGQKIERTPERVRQGLNAVAELAERMERFEYAKAKAEQNEKIVRNEARSLLNSLQGLKRLVDPFVVPKNASKEDKR